MFEFVESLCKAWFPSWYPPVCRASDFLCHRYDGLVKLADYLPESAMVGMDWCVKNPFFTLASLAGTTLVGAGAVVYHHLHKKQVRFAEPLPKYVPKPGSPFKRVHKRKRPRPS